MGEIESVNYDKLVNLEDHRNALEEADLFTLELIHFLESGSLAKLSLLIPEIDQRQFDVFKLLIETANLKQLIPSKVMKQILYDGRPYFARFYDSLAVAPSTTSPEEEVAGMIGNLASPKFTLITRWGTVNDFNPTLSLQGAGLTNFTTNVSFTGLPRKIITQEDAHNLLSSFTPMTDKTEYEIKDEGNHVIRNHVGEPFDSTLDERVRTEHHFSIGAFTGSHSQRAFHIYANNDMLGLVRRGLDFN